MAAFTGNVGMRTIDHKASAEVIERLLRPGITWRKQADSNAR